MGCSGVRLRQVGWARTGGHLAVQLADTAGGSPRGDGCGFSPTSLHAAGGCSRSRVRLPLTQAEKTAARDPQSHQHTRTNGDTLSTRVTVSPASVTCCSHAHSCSVQTVLTGHGGTLPATEGQGQGQPWELPLPAHVPARSRAPGLGTGRETWAVPPGHCLAPGRAC